LSFPSLFLQEQNRKQEPIFNLSSTSPAAFPPTNPCHYHKKILGSSPTKITLFLSKKNKK